jgi:acyl carrier protein
LQILASGVAVIYLRGQKDANNGGPEKPDSACCEKGNRAMVPENPVMNAVKNFILETFLPGEDPGKLTPTTPLITAGILDSIATLKLIMFLEEKFNIEVKAHEADEEHLNTLQAICELVEAKR